jgi:acyl CoA:acetate/3-ketoacid CoA transferase alpha subunit
MDESEFFRKFAVRICGSLEIEKALASALLYAGEAMPVDELALGHVAIEQGVIEFVATARRDGCAKISVKAAIPARLRKELSSSHAPELRVIDDSRRSMMDSLVKALGWPPSSLLINALTVGGVRIGFMVARASGSDRFFAEHARLWACTTEPAAVALSNYLTHRELMELKNRLADDNRFLKDELRVIAGT